MAAHRRNDGPAGATGSCMPTWLWSDYQGTFNLPLFLFVVVMLGAVWTETWLEPISLQIIIGNETFDDGVDHNRRDIHAPLWNPTNLVSHRSPFSLNGQSKSDNFVDIPPHLQHCILLLHDPLGCPVSPLVSKYCRVGADWKRICLYFWLLQNPRQSWSKSCFDVGACELIEMLTLNLNAQVTTQIDLLMKESLWFRWWTFMFSSKDTSQNMALALTF